MSPIRLDSKYPRAIAVTTKIPVDVVRAIETLAAVSNQSRSDYVRSVINAHLTEIRKAA